MIAPDRLRAWTDDVATDAARIHGLLDTADEVVARWRRHTGGTAATAALDSVRTVLARWLRLLAVADLVADQVEALDERLSDGPLATLVGRIGAVDATPRHVARVLAALDTVDRVATLWRTLPPATTSAILRRTPHLVGSVDGVDLHDRDRANRHLIGQRLAEWTRDLGRLEAGAADVATIDDAVGATASDLLAARAARQRQRIAALRSLLASDLVLVWDPTGDGRAVVAWGDPSRASHVATFVPGMSNSLATFGRVMRDAASLHTHATRIGTHAGIAPTRMPPAPGAAGEATRGTPAAHPTVATVAWLGYDAPSGFGWGLAEAATDARARGQSGALVAWTHALEAANPSARHTVVAHSYGSVVAAQALRAGAGGAFVHDLVVLGSPGLGTGIAHADDLHLDGGRLLVGRAPGDLVPHLPALGPDPAGLPGAVLVPQGLTNSGHSNYLATDSVGLDAVARVVRGLPTRSARAW